MPTQHPVPPICLLWGPAGAAMSTPFIVPRVCLPPEYCQGRVGSSKQKSQVQVHLHLYSRFHPEKSYQYFVLSVPTNPTWLLEPDGLSVTAQKGPETKLRPFRH